jgi:hypothetical protein
MKNIEEVLKMKISQRDRLAREIDCLQQAVRILEMEPDNSTPPVSGQMVPEQVKVFNPDLAGPVKRWP